MYLLYSLGSLRIISAFFISEKSKDVDTTITNVLEGKVEYSKQNQDAGTLLGSAVSAENLLPHAASSCIIL